MRDTEKSACALLALRDSVTVLSVMPDSLLFYRVTSADVLICSFTVLSNTSTVHL